MKFVPINGAKRGERVLKMAPVLKILKKVLARFTKIKIVKGKFLKALLKNIA